MAEPLVRETQKLYALPLSEFTAVRNARAKALKRDDPELAAAVAALPKPSLAAGALNELVHGWAKAHTHHSPTPTSCGSQPGCMQ